MSFIGRLFGRYRPKPGVAPVSADKLKHDLLALNRPTAPFIIRECTADDPENADLVAEWRMHNPAWYAAFGSANLSKSFQVFMRLMADQHEVQSIDWTWDVTWSGGVPSFSYQKKGERGLNWDYVFGVRPFYETTPSGERIAYRFSSSELKKPLHELVTGSGWSWRSRLAGRLPHGSHAEELRRHTPLSARSRWIYVAVAFVLSFGIVNELLAPISIMIETRSMPGSGGILPYFPMILSAIVAIIIARVVHVRVSR